MYRSHVLVCGGTGCTSSGSPQIMEALKAEIERQGLSDEVAVVETGCHGLCALGPIMIVYPDATFYSMVQPGDVPEIVSEHLLKGRPVTRLLYQETVSPSGGIKALSDTDFYQGFKRHRFLQEAAPDCPAQLRRHQSGEHRRVYRHWRLPGPGQGAHRDDAR